MKKILSIIFALALLFTSCDDCGCNSSVEKVELKNPEVKVYKLYSSGSNYNVLRVYRYDAQDVTIIQYKLNDDTRNISIIPKAQTIENSNSEENANTGIFEQENYFNF